MQQSSQPRRVFVVTPAQTLAVILLAVLVLSLLLVVPLALTSWLVFQIMGKNDASVWLWTDIVWTCVLLRWLSTRPKEGPTTVFITATFTEVSPGSTWFGRVAEWFLTRVGASARE